MNEGTVYDLGEVERAPAQAPSAPHTAPPRPRTSAPTTWRDAATARPAARGCFDYSGSLSLFVPGTGQLFRAEWAHGLFYLTAIGFLLTLGWAVVGTLDRLTETSVLLGHSRGTGLWVLGGIYATAAALHLINVATREPDSPSWGAAHPVAAGCASAVVPGWGQVINGRPRRAAIFLGGLWLIGASWLLVSPPAQEIYVALDVHLPRALQLFSSAPVRWTLPAVVWALSIYDAAAGTR